MEIEWWSVDFLTGTRIGRVDVAPAAFERVIGEPTQSVLKVLASSNSVKIPGWDEKTGGRRSLLVAVDKASDYIVWGGLVLRRGRKTGPWVAVTVETLEGYLQQRYISSPVSWSDADPAQVAVDALGIITDLPPLTVSATMTGNAIVDGYFDESDRMRIGGLLEDLSNLAGGIQWTVDLEWVDADHTQMRYVVRVAPRIGTPGGVAATQWKMPGCVKDFDYIEDFGEESFANDVIAFSSGEGDSKPRSTRYEDTALLTQFARFERRFDPARSITSTLTLDQYAEAELARVRLGVTTLTLTASLDDAATPRVNLDWWMGDDIDVSLTCDAFPRQLDADGMWQAGFEGRLTTTGWTIDCGARTITPRIAGVVL